MGKVLLYLYIFLHCLRVSVMLMGALLIKMPGWMPTPPQVIGILGTHVWDGDKSTISHRWTHLKNQL